MSNPHNPADAQHVVIQNGKRVTGTLSEDEARREAKRLNQQITESGQQPQQEQQATVKRNICG